MDIWIDFIDMIKHHYAGDKTVKFIEVDGRSDMKLVYPKTSILIRPNRSDGASRMVQEARIQGIPVYHTQREKPFSELLDFVQKHYDAKFN